MTKTIRLISFFLVITFTFLSAQALERKVTPSIASLQGDVLEQLKTTPAAQILLVYDLDNTLLAMDHDLGSDQWFNWQSNLLKQKDNKDLVAQNIEQLLDLQFVIFSMGKMHPVEAITSEVVANLQSKGIKSILLTSRGPRFRADTEDELQRAKISFIDSAFGPYKGYAGTFLPEGIERPREVSYMNGLAMGSGSDKGLFLKALLNKTGQEYKTVYFIDDTLKNIENMEAAYGKDFDLRTYYYTHEDPRVKQFTLDKKQAIQDFKRLSETLRKSFDYN